MRKISEVMHGKEKYMGLLLLGDEQEEMVRRYLDRGRLFVMDKDGAACGVCVVTDEGELTLELKNIAVAEEFQRQGIGRELISFIENKFAGQFRRLTAGTGDSPLTVPFYESCGFRRTYIVKDFFIENYDHPIIEAGVQLRDMIYFEKAIQEKRS